MFLTSRVFDRCQDLSGNTESGKRLKRSVTALVIIADRLEQTDHTLLDQVVAIAADQIEFARARPDEALVALQERLGRRRVSGLTQLRQGGVFCFVVVFGIRCDCFISFAALFSVVLLYAAIQNTLRCFAISKARIPAATEAFRESISPCIGIEAR